ncbi:acyl carrier protein [Acetatifactor muris]|jgi:acyl carrier protein|uniref:Acyl carrier protein n=1 Tax=Acetatifactor muris TaxID=879566 RepID=A0A2K4ZCL2_9FIRM|nr:acyl carrier protein [Acetatifactor muris]MCI8800991.1 acyl carrier protein [Lachnospiraceae bacterium]MCR2046625.1 acyl carrier protein [Acetatifactor muris]SOY28214.1 Acyl carrier protein [Acetatifactor muris]
MFEKLKAVIEENLSVEGAEITENTDFKEDLGADSLDLFELVMALEEEFGIDIPSEDLEKLATVGDVMKYLADKGVDL